MTDKDPPPLTDSQLGDFLFLELKIPIDDVIQLDFSSRSDSKQILVKQSTILTHIVTDHKDLPHSHKDHEITISAISSQFTKVTFIHVPLTVPDEELRHLCSLHGTLTDGIVHRVYVKLGGISKASIPGPTRWLNVQITKPLRNYYWLTGPGQSESGRRVTVLHSNQGPRQCSWCLKSGAPSGSPILASHCHGGGNIGINTSTPYYRVLNTQ